MHGGVLAYDQAVGTRCVGARVGALNLLPYLRAQHGLAMLFVSHDLSVVNAWPTAWW